MLSLTIYIRFLDYELIENNMQNIIGMIGIELHAAAKTYFLKDIINMRL